MNEQELKLVGESIWNTYRNIASLLLGEESETDPHAEGGPDVPKIAHDDPTARKRPKEMSKATKLAKKGQKKAQEGR
jgi:hypothetical protein